ncbi:hypothetical protein PVAND_001849 [Polypedilum vanderplanki]|uniref:Phosphotyrosine protein phosphatase I domain-containing protein n=1 Tax=Polypedilum vanderplanki TaxID=319348 RepID=A0A9J6BQF7_POLVA|nr:hypothetical protein PVAND_001849 [Polypedilum vanderplanki]
MSSNNSLIKVLFVCFGNTCSNLESQFLIDSAALNDWQQGCDVNPKVDVILKRIGIKNFTHKARPISYKDYEKFDFMFGMDYFHIEDMLNAADALKSQTKIYLLGEFNPNENDKVIKDPIGSPMSSFEKCYEQISICCERLLEKILNKSI